jgi:hypothetical protein
MGTTRLEFVTSGRSVAISFLAVGQEFADASTAASDASTGTKLILKTCLFTETLIETGIEWCEATIGIVQLGPVARDAIQYVSCRPLADFVTKIATEFNCRVVRSLE